MSAPVPDRRRVAAAGQRDRPPWSARSPSSSEATYTARDRMGDDVVPASRFDPWLN
jgi:hypothetical protein